MPDESRPPFLDFVPDRPTRESITTAIRKWFAGTWYFATHVLYPTDRFLPKPARQLGAIHPSDLYLAPREAETIGPYTEAVRRLVSDGDERLNTLRAKSSNLLGFVTLVTPVFAWWLLSGRDRLSNASAVAATLSNWVGVLAVFSLCLALRALLRTQAVVGFDGPSIDLVISVERCTLKPYDRVEELRRLVLRWGQLQRWSDDIADHFRGGQRFLVIALVASLVAGGICYAHPGVATPVLIVSSDDATTPSEPEASLTFVQTILLIGTGGFVVFAIALALAFQAYLLIRYIESLAELQREQQSEAASRASKDD